MNASRRSVPLARLTTIGTGGPRAAFARPFARRAERGPRWAAERGLPSWSSDWARTLCPQPTPVSTRSCSSSRATLPQCASRGAADRGGGAPNAVCLHQARAAGLGGFEFACAIPGTAGGGVRMNAGAYGSDWSQILARAQVVSATGDEWLTPRSSASPTALRATPRAGRRRGRVRLSPRPAGRDREAVRELIAQRKGDPADEQAHVRQRLQEPEHELGAGRMLEACGLGATGSAVRSSRPGMRTSSRTRAVRRPRTRSR